MLKNNYFTLQELIIAVICLTCTIVILCGLIKTNKTDAKRMSKYVTTIVSLKNRVDAIEKKVAWLEKRHEAERIPAELPSGTIDELIYRDPLKLHRLDGEPDYDYLRLLIDGIKNE